MKMKKKKPTKEELEKLNVKSWGIWEKDVSEFPWSYSETETCYILEGEVEVMDKDTGEKMDFKSGDLVQFSDELKNCIWNVKKPIRKHYNFNLKFGDIDNI